jgi:hypothetical protein
MGCHLSVKKHKQEKPLLATKGINCHLTRLLIATYISLVCFNPVSRDQRPSIFPWPIFEERYHICFSSLMAYLLYGHMKFPFSILFSAITLHTEV